MVSYQDTRFKLTNAQLDKSKSAAKIRGTILRLNKKNFKDEELPRELFLTTRLNKIKNCPC